MDAHIRNTDSHNFICKGALQVILSSPLPKTRQCCSDLGPSSPDTSKFHKLWTKSFGNWQSSQLKKTFLISYQNLLFFNLCPSQMSKITWDLTLKMQLTGYYLTTLCYCLLYLKVFVASKEFLNLCETLKFVFQALARQGVKKNLKVSKYCFWTRKVMRFLPSDAKYRN